jgi:signal transduction histidine kinase
MLSLGMSPALFAAVMVLAVGGLILWSNPRRDVNRVVFTCSVHFAIWLWCLHRATTTSEGLYWLRWTCVVSASIPFHFWVVLKETIVGGERRSLLGLLRHHYLWIAITVFQTVLPLTEAFIPSHSTSAVRVYGWGYYTYIGVTGALYVIALIASYFGTRRLLGGRRLELQVWLLGGCAMTILILSLMIVNRVTGNPIYARLYQPLAMILFYTVTAVAITTGRIFDARQVFLVVAEKTLLILCIAVVAYYVDTFLTDIFDNNAAVAWACTAAVTIWVAGLVNAQLNRWFQFYPEATGARRAVFEAAKSELTVDGLEQAFLPVLRGWGSAGHAVVLSGPKDEIKGCGIKLPPNAPMVDTLRRIRWATPERLARERSDPERDEILQFMAAHQLGVLVCSRGLSLTILVGVGIPVSRRPFTFPQVQQLIELAEIMESALERAHFSMRAQQAERLATVGLLGAGVAHEIRNPLVTIKTFVQLLPQRHQEEGFRRKFFQLISEEITRIDRLTERLMELGSPRSYFMVAQPLHPLLRGTLELVEPKAADHGVDIATDFQAGPDVIDTDAAAARQVLLNLCLNAVHAMENVTGPRRLRLATRNVPGGVEVSIADTGPGLASEMLPRLFTPFQSTKSTGFGLGLAISSEIMSGLKGTIAADPPRAGEGATFRLIFPCPSPSS